MVVRVAPTSRPVDRLRCVAVLGLATLVALGALILVAPTARAGLTAVHGGSAAGAPFEVMLVWLCAAGATIAVGWCWLQTAATVGRLLVRSGDRSGGGPVRRLVLVACGVALVGSAGTLTAAQATPPHADPTVAVALGDHGDLHGLPLPDRPTGPIGEADERVVVVAPGDCLWSIAVSALGGRADAATVTRYWRQVHQLNRSVIGPDPDLVRPGQRLVLPGRRSEPTVRLEPHADRAEMTERTAR